MINLPPPKIITVDGFTVIDDHEVGTKYRMALALASQSLKKDFYYATTESGDSPSALARACHEQNKNLILFTTRLTTKDYTPTLKLAEEFGAAVVVHEDATEHEIVYDRASKAARANGGEFIDFDNKSSIQVLADIARSLQIDPEEVWSASAKGAMCRAYQLAWPNARHNAYAVMDHSQADFGSAKIYHSDMLYEERFMGDVPFGCNRNYEAKAWDFMKRMAKPSKNTVFWNPAGPN